MASGDTLLQWSPASKEPVSSNGATPDTRNNRPCLDFDASTNEYAVFSGIMPQHYDGGGVELYLHFAMSTATSGDVDLDACFERVGDSQQDVDSDGFASVQSNDNITVPGTCGYVDIVYISFTNGAQMDYVVAGEGFRTKVNRDAVSDTASGDLELYWAELREA